MLVACAFAVWSCDATGPGDTTMPVVNGAAAPIAGYTVYVPGDTLRLELTAVDDQRLAWIGYAIDASILVRDSVAITAAAASVTRPLVIGAGWTGTVELSVFAIDAAGNTAERVVDTITIVDARRRPWHSQPLAGWVFDVGYDAARSVVYLSQPYAQQIAVYHLPTHSYRPPIALFGSPWGFDQSLSGDSLVVALRRTHFLAFVNLVTGVVDTVRLALQRLPLSGPAHVRVMASGKALITLTCDPGCTGYWFRIWEYSFATHSSRERADAAFVSESVPLVRNAARQRLLAVLEGGCCPVQTWVYEAAPDRFSVYDTTVSRYYPPLSSDTAADRFLIGMSVFDAALRPVATLVSSRYNDGPTVIALDGQAAYLAMEHGYVKVRIPDSSMFEHVMLPLTPERLVLLPDGITLLATAWDAEAGEYRLILVDLRN